MKRKKKTVFLIVPCYNEDGNIKAFHDEVKKAFLNENYSVELIFINDGSTDKTLTELRKLSATSSLKINIISFSRNFGKEAAMYAGLEKFSYLSDSQDYAVIIDADLQQQPSLILKMLSVLEKGEYDCVCYYQEQRIENKLVSFFKKSFYRLMTKISDVEFVNGASDFRCFNKYVVDAILSLKEKNRFSKGIFSWIGFNTCYLPYIPKERVNGISSFSFFKLLKYAISGMISFSIMPLRLATFSGLFCSGIAFIYLIIVICQKLFFTINVPGYATLLVCILFIGGLVLCCLGIIGEYLARVYVETKNRPIYIAKENFSNYERKK